MNTLGEHILTVSIPREDNLSRSADHARARDAGETIFQSNMAVEIRSKFAGVWILRESANTGSGKLTIKLVGQPKSDGFKDFMAMIAERNLEVTPIEDYETSDQDAGRRTD